MNPFSKWFWMYLFIQDGIEIIPSLTLSQWSSSGNPVCLELRPQCTLECHWINTSVLPVAFQWPSSGLPVSSNYANWHWITTGTPLGASISQCGSSGISVYFWLQWSSSVFELCTLTLDRHWNTTGCYHQPVWFQWHPSVIVAPVVFQWSVQWYPSVLIESSLEVIRSGHFPACDPQCIQLVWWELFELNLFHLTWNPKCTKTIMVLISRACTE